MSQSAVYDHGAKAHQSVFPLLGKTPDTRNLTEERFHFAHGFKGFTPQSASANVGTNGGRAWLENCLVTAWQSQGGAKQ